MCIEPVQTLDKFVKMINNINAGASPNRLAKSLLGLDFIPCKLKF